MTEQQSSPSRRGRKLTLQARAARQEETRARIVTAAVDLHQELGPIATTISAIADRAGVERLTVYRHFPDQSALLEACTQHFFARNQPPGLAAWAAIADPEERLRHALLELYAYWESTEGMLSSVLADHQHDGARSGGGAMAFMASASRTLLADWQTSPAERRRLRAAVGHAVHFYTWRTLAHEHGLPSSTAAAMMTTFVLTAAHHAGPPPKKR